MAVELQFLVTMPPWQGQHPPWQVCSPVARACLLISALGSGLNAGTGWDLVGATGRVREPQDGTGRHGTFQVMLLSTASEMADASHTWFLIIPSMCPGLAVGSKSAFFRGCWRRKVPQCLTTSS